MNNLHVRSAFLAFAACLTTACAESTAPMPRASLPAPPAPLVESKTIVKVQQIHTLDATKITELTRVIPGAVVLSEPESNSIVIKGTQEAVDQVSALVNKLESSIPEKTDPTIVFVYALKNAKAEELTSVLKEMMKSGFFESPQEAEPFAFVADTRSNSLIIRMDKSLEPKTRELLDSLDRPLETHNQLPAPKGRG